RGRRRNRRLGAERGGGRGEEQQGGEQSTSHVRFPWVRYRDRGSSRPRQVEAAVSRPTLHDNWSCTRLQSSGRPSAKGAGSGSRTFGTATISRGEVPSIGAIGRRPDGDRTPFGCLSGRATAPWTDPGSHPKLGL